MPNDNNMPGLGALGMQAAGGAIGTIFGLANNWMQQGANAANIKRQVEAQKQLTDYNFKKQLEMWEATGYEAQKKQIEKAGLNPGILYGGSGAGGQTSNIAQGTVGMGAAPSAGGENIQVMGMMAQIALVDAQRKKIEAEIKDLEGSAKNRPKIGENLDADTALKKANTRLQNISANIADDTYYEAVGKIIEEARITHEELNQWVRTNHIGRETQDTTIAQYRANLAKTNAEIIVAQAQAKGINMNTAYVQKQVDTFYEKLASELRVSANQGRMATVAERNAAVNEAAQNADKNFKEQLIELGQWEIFTNSAGKIIQMITPMKGKTPTIGFPRH